MISRNLQGLVERRLLQFPAIALLGLRQVGKTTLAKAIAARDPRAPMLVVLVADLATLLQ